MKLIKKGDCIFYPIIDLKSGFDLKPHIDTDPIQQRDIVRWINRNVNRII
jgi:hypothetical protein